MNNQSIIVITPIDSTISESILLPTLKVWMSSIQIVKIKNNLIWGKFANVKHKYIIRDKLTKNCPLGTLKEGAIFGESDRNYERYFFTNKEAKESWRRMHKLVLQYALQNKIDVPEIILNDYKELQTKE